MQAKFHGNPSYAWCSIMEARKAIERGSMWWVGMGHHIKVCTTTVAYTAIPVTYMIMSRHRILDANASVNELIDSHKN